MASRDRRAARVADEALAGADASSGIDDRSRHTDKRSSSMRRVILTALTPFALLAGPALRAQQPSPVKPLIIVDGVPQPDPRQQPGQGDPFARFFIPPELVMQHQAEISLTDAQRSTLMTA